MNKKARSIICFIVIVLVIIGSYYFYLNNKNKNRNLAIERDDAEAVEIVMDQKNSKYFTEYEKGQMYKFIMDTGINIKIKYINAENSEEYRKKLNELLYKSEGPTLIFISQNDLFYEYIDNGIALKISDKLSNYDEIYECLKQDYFVPINIKLKPMTISQKNTMNLDYKIKPTAEGITETEFMNLRKEWLESDFRDINMLRFDECMEYAYSNFELIDMENKSVDVTSEEFIRYLQDMYVEFHSDNYNKLYDYDMDAYKRLIKDWNSEECQNSLENIYGFQAKDFRVLDVEEMLNLLNISKNYYVKDYNDIFIMNPVFKTFALSTRGYIVNSKGKNIESGLAFLDRLLDAENQIQYFYKIEEYGNSPSNSNSFKLALDNDDKMKKKEWELKKMIKADELLRQNIYEPYTYWPIVYYQAKNMIENKVIEIVFKDEIGEVEDIKRELKYLENKLNIMVNE